MQVIPTQDSWRLTLASAALRIVEKRVVLADVDRYFENLTFLL